MSTTERILASPPVNAESKPFWDAAQEGRFMIKHCNACDSTHYYPRSICPFCFSAKTVWKEAAGTGEIYSFSVMRRVTPSYVLAYVTLAEGITILSNIVGCETDAVRIGADVKVSFVASADGQLVPVFKLLAS